MAHWSWTPPRSRDHYLGQPNRRNGCRGRYIGADRCAIRSSTIRHRSQCTLVRKRHDIVGLPPARVPRHSVRSKPAHHSTHSRTHPRGWLRTRSQVRSHSEGRRTRSQVRSHSQGRHIRNQVRSHSQGRHIRSQVRSHSRGRRIRNQVRSFRRILNCRSWGRCRAASESRFRRTTHSPGRLARRRGRAAHSARGSGPARVTASAASASDATGR